MLTPSPPALSLSIAVVALILRLTTYDTYHQDGPSSGSTLPIVLQGSLLLQPFFNFKPSINDVFASRCVRGRRKFGRGRPALMFHLAL